MGGGHDDHGDAPIHQAPWVMWITLFICFTAVFALLALKIAIN